MKSLTKTSFILSFACMSFALAVGSPALAQSDESAPPAARHHHHHHRHSFGMGICVGQALAAQGVTVPPHVPGQRPAPDAAQKAAFQAAIQSCNAESASEAPAPPST